jgi:N-acetylglucosaminyl-diphospho-decaprenol L-rhamnosyltransferase
LSLIADPRVSAIVITRNRSCSLAEALTRIAELPEAPPVIVVDNASSDGTAQMVKAGFPGVTVLRLRRNRGAAARNVGVAYARTPYVAFSDDDSWWAPGALRRGADELDQHPGLALVAARILVGAGESPDRSCSLMADSPLGRGEAPGPSVLGFLACGAIVRRSAFQAVGGFRAGWGVGGEEQLLAVDLAEAGYRLAYVDGVAAHHHPRGHGAGRSLRQAETLRNDLWFAWLRRSLSGAVRETVSLCAGALPDRQARAAVARGLAGAAWVLCARRPVSRGLDRDLQLLRRQRRAAPERPPPLPVAAVRARPALR